MGGNTRDALLRLLAQTNRKLDALERKALRELAKLYRRASREILGEMEARRQALAASGLAESEISARLARDGALRQQIAARLKALDAEVQGTIEDAIQETLEVTRAAEDEEAEILGQGLGMEFQVIDWASIEVGLPQALAAFSQSHQALAELLLTELRGGLLRGESFPQLAKRVLDTDAGLFARGKTSAMLAVRRNVIHANNAARDALYRRWSKNAPGLMKQAVAAIDERTTNCCLQVQGQIQPLGKPYRLEGTPRFAAEVDYPPFHWNCRAASLPYHPDFERGATTTTADMVTAAQAELEAREDGSRVEIHPAHATSKRSGS